LFKWPYGHWERGKVSKNLWLQPTFPLSQTLTPYRWSLLRGQLADL